MGETVLVLGGARSGKTRMAERLAAENRPVTYVATAHLDPADAEMAARVARHRAQRPEDWTTREVNRDLDSALADLVRSEGTVVVDCGTRWLSTLMLGLGGGPSLEDDAILDAVGRAGDRAGEGVARVIFVSNEVGSGVVPDNALARRFADLQGWANQRLAEACGTVYLCVAGLPLRLK
jgi:adenosylcobinamide kinase/adenosylcobinamide-phosphate guanylyltransferase